MKFLLALLLGSVAAFAPTRPQARVPTAIFGDRVEGTVKWFNSEKGFGFIMREGEGDVFLHYSEIRAEDNGYRTITEGARVEFEVTQGAKGPQAVDCVELDPMY